MRPAQRNPDIRPSSIATSNRWPASRELSTRRNADPTALRSRSRMIVYRICVIASPADGDGSATHHRTIAGDVSIQPDPDLARRQMPRTPSAPSSVRFCHLAAVDIYHHRHGAPVVSIHPSRDQQFSLWLFFRCIAAFRVWFFWRFCGWRDGLGAGAGDQAFAGGGMPVMTVLMRTAHDAKTW